MKLRDVPFMSNHAHGCTSPIQHNGLGDLFHLSQTLSIFPRQARPHKPGLTSPVRHRLSSRLFELAGYRSLGLVGKQASE